MSAVYLISNQAAVTSSHEICLYLSPLLTIRREIPQYNYYINITEDTSQVDTIELIQQQMPMIKKHIINWSHY